MTLSPCISLPLNKKELDNLAEVAKDWAFCHGIGMRSKDSKDGLTFVPFLLLPSTFPRPEFEKIVQVQAILQKLVHLVSEDEAFLRKALASTRLADEFTDRLMKIWETTSKEGLSQKISLGLIRSDYILDSPSLKAKQVEINMIASSFGALTSILPEFHKYALNHLGHQKLAEEVRSSGTLSGFSNGILRAWELYNVKTCESNIEYEQREIFATSSTIWLLGGAAILFVCEDPTYNICDQRLLEFEIVKQNRTVNIIRMSLTNIGRKAQLEPKTKAMTIDGITIGVIYFRDGYSPQAYKSELEWDARLLMERSNAIKCPSIQYQLVGSKKIQQELARPGVLEMFLSDPNEVLAVRDVFTGLYSLDMDEKDVGKIIDKAISIPGDYVLKPQREGGGNNMYDEDIKRYLEAHRDSIERTAWILMKKIKGPLQQNYMLRPGLDQPILGDMTNEIGIFGVLIGEMGNKLHVNEYVGQMLRTKVSSSNEAGVASGFGALDSVLLTD